MEREREKGRWERGGEGEKERWERKKEEEGRERDGFRSIMSRFASEHRIVYTARNNMADITASIQPSGLSGGAFKRTDPVLWNHIWGWKTHHNKERHSVRCCEVCYSALLCIKLFSFKYLVVILHKAVKDKAQNQKWSMTHWFTRTALLGWEWEDP